MYCQHCGNELPEGAKVCPKCGKEVVTEISVKKDDVFAFVSLICFGLSILILLISILISWGSNAYNGWIYAIISLILEGTGFGFLIPTLIIKKKNENE